jgi:hypothetical protein
LRQLLYCPLMIKGFNSDVVVLGKSYHVQSEDWGMEKSTLISRVFCNGAVVKTIKTSYAEAVRTGPVSDGEALRQALRRQHAQILEDLSTGKL